MSFEDRIKQFSSAYEMLSQPIPPAALMPYPPVHSNWRDEQRAWATTATLFNQSWHMTDLYIKGPDALRLLSDTSVNSYKNFGPGRAKQYLAVNHQGYVVGDGILFGLADEEFLLVGSAVPVNWAQYHAESGNYDVTLSREEGLVATGTVGATPKSTFRYEIEGPNAQKILERAIGHKIEPLGFFKMAEFDIAGTRVRALSHTMAAAPGAENTGLELFGPEESHQEFLDAILNAGEDFGLVQGGSFAYLSTLAESGWRGSPFPAIFTDELLPYRQWLPDFPTESVYGSFGLRGSYRPSTIEGYYSAPWDLGYGRMIKFDHDFVGREALEVMSDKPHRAKVWLRWDPEDTKHVLVASELGHSDAPRLLPIPEAQYLNYDEVRSGEQLVGVTGFHGYTVNLGEWVSIAAVDEEYAVDGTELDLMWGDYDGGAGNPYIPNHSMTKIRVTVSTKSPIER